MTSLDDARRALLRKAFKMPQIGSIRSRTSTITNAFVTSVVPFVFPSEEEIEEALAVLQMDPEDMRCAYCGDPFTEWDHLRPLVIGRRPSGYISEIANLVPACSKCNQSKRNTYWRDWMLSTRGRSPTARNLADIGMRIARLEAYEQWRAPTKVDFEAFATKDEWERYWTMYDKALVELAECQTFASEMLNRAFKWLGCERPGRRSRRVIRRQE